MRISLRVKAHASKVSVKKLENNSYTVSVTEPPEDGKANRGVIRALAKHFKVPQSNINILSGHAVRSKMVNIEK
ncbi:MAG: DUF167 domain-containing protein [Patescibacteria group bacterium]